MATRKLMDTKIQNEIIIEIKLTTESDSLIAIPPFSNNSSTNHFSIKNKTNAIIETKPKVTAKYLVNN